MTGASIPEILDFVRVALIIFDLLFQPDEE
jgi:hypothetical protein